MADPPINHLKLKLKPRPARQAFACLLLLGSLTRFVVYPGRKAVSRKVISSGSITVMRKTKTKALFCCFDRQTPVGYVV